MDENAQREVPRSVLARHYSGDHKHNYWAGHTAHIRERNAYRICGNLKERHHLVRQRHKWWALQRSDVAQDTNERQYVNIRDEEFLNQLRTISFSTRALLYTAAHFVSQNSLDLSQIAAPKPFTCCCSPTRSCSNVSLYLTSETTKTSPLRLLLYMTVLTTTMI